MKSKTVVGNFEVRSSSLQKRQICYDTTLNAFGVYNNNTWIYLQYPSATANTANTLALRDANGRFQAADPSAAQDVATKAYVDAIQQGIAWKAQCVLPQLPQEH